GEGVRLPRRAAPPRGRAARLRGDGGARHRLHVLLVHSLADASPVAAAGLKKRTGGSSSGSRAALREQGPRGPDPCVPGGTHAGDTRPTSRSAALDPASVLRALSSAPC